MNCLVAQESIDTRILIVEDDPHQVEWFADRIWEKLPCAGIEYFDSEYSYFQAFNDPDYVRSNKFDTAFIGLSMPYYSAQDLAILEEVPDFTRNPHKHSAGLRMYDDFTARFPYVPARIITIIDQTTVPQSYPVLDKLADDLPGLIHDFLNA